MNFFKYIQTDAAAFWENYLEEGWVQIQHHQDFPLDIYNYTRATVHENKWDAVTSKCRGIIVNRDTGEIVARPFEKFFNFGSELVDTADGVMRLIASQQPVVWEKMDGFMCTMYRWENKDYIASKGSFHSIHAKWATAQIRAKFGDRLPVVLGGKTLVFEGLHRDLRIVIDYKERQELVLLAVIDNETGAEYSPESIESVATELGFNTPLNFQLTLEQARAGLDYTGTGEEGYVLTWYRDGMPPFRLKIKFIEYLRLHRMVTGVSPKRVWEVLSTGQSAELQEYLNHSTPWFSDFVQKWIKTLNAEYLRIYNVAIAIYNDAHEACRVKVGQRPYANMGEERRAYAHEFLREPNKEFSGVCFAMLDGKQIAPVIWKMVRRMTHGANPLVDAHNT